MPTGVNSVPSPTGPCGGKSGGRLSIALVRSSDSGRGLKPRGGRRHGAQGGIGENPDNNTLVTLLPGSAGCQQQATPRFAGESLRPHHRMPMASSTNAKNQTEYVRQKKT